MNKITVEQLSRRYDDLKDRILTYYQHCAPREQKLLTFTLAVLPLVVVIFGLIMPVHDRIAELEQEEVVAQQQLFEAEGLALRLQESLGSKGDRGDVLMTVEQASRELKIRQYITHMKPTASLSGKKSLMIQMKDLPYSGLIRFLDRMGQAGVALEKLKLGSTGKPGIVEVEMKLQ